MANPYFRNVPNFEYVSREVDQKSISDYSTVKNLFKRAQIRDDIFQNLKYFEKYQIIGDERPDNVAYKFYNDSTLDWVILLSNNITNIQTQWPIPQTILDSLLIEKYGTYENLYSGIHHYETLEVKNSRGEIILNSGRNIKPSWKTDGNFVSAYNFGYDFIETVTLDNLNDIVEVTLRIPIEGLKIGDSISAFGFSDDIFNGNHIISSTIKTSFGFVQSFSYTVESGSLITEAVLNGSESFEYTPPEELFSNKFYYEFYDNYLSSTVRIPAESMLRPVLNFEHESFIENQKRNIFVLKPNYLNVVFNDLDNIMEYKKGSEQYVSRTLKRADNIRLYD
jgi:hypothetical protein